MARATFFVSGLRKAIKFHERVQKNMLRAASIVVQNQAKRNVRGGFTTGNWVTGNILNKITHEITRENGILISRIGTDVDYGRHWELGHDNVITGKYERVPWLKPAFVMTEGAQQKAAEKAAKATKVLGEAALTAIGRG